MSNVLNFLTFISTDICKIVISFVIFFYIHDVKTTKVSIWQPFGWNIPIPLGLLKKEEVYNMVVVYFCEAICVFLQVNQALNWTWLKCCKSGYFSNVTSYVFLSIKYSQQVITESLLWPVSPVFRGGPHLNISEVSLPLTCYFSSTSFTMQINLMQEILISAPCHTYLKLNITSCTMHALKR